LIVSSGDEEENIAKKRVAEMMKTSRTTLESLQHAAKIVGQRLRVELV
jgi:hypothetical protein